MYSTVLRTFTFYMLKMRLQRVGRRNDPSYRIVVVDSRTGPKSNKHVELLGSYNPKLNHTQLDVERAKEWLAKGVQPSDTLFNILVTEGVVDGPKRNVLPKKSPIVSESAQEEGSEAPEEKEDDGEGSETPEVESAPATEEVTSTESEETNEAAEESSEEQTEGASKGAEDATEEVESAEEEPEKK